MWSILKAEELLYKEKYNLDGELPDFEGKEDFEQAKVNLQEKSGQSGGGNPGTSGTELGQKPAGMAEEQAESQASSSKKESKIGEKKGKSGGRSDAMKHGKNSKEKVDGR